MEFLDGETLSARLRRGPLSLAEALPIISDIAAALDAAHAASIIHRDFKSPNVILCVTSNGLRAKVTDFGLARDEALPQSDKLSSELEVLGSPAYIAPEQLTGESITSAVDVYAFGVVMFEMVTGRLPFVGTTPLLTAMLRMQETPPSVRSLVRTIPLSWDHVIARCLSRRPEARFRSASDAVHALALVATARPTRRWMAPLVLVVACALAAVAWISAEKPAVVEKAPSARVVGERHVDVAQRESSTGVVVIRSDPPGARITIDDDDAGFTPAIKSLVLPHEISLSLDGYVPIREVITHAGEVLVPLTRRHVTKSRIMPPIPITAPIAKPIPTREGLD